MSNVDAVLPTMDTVTFDDGVERRIKFALSSYAYLEKQYGSVDIAMEKLEEGSVIAIIDITYAGLKTFDKQITVEEVGDAMSMTDVAKIAPILISSLGKQIKALDEAGINLPEDAQALIETGEVVTDPKA